jgi:hypothetical protein
MEIIEPQPSSRQGVTSPIRVAVWRATLVVVIAVGALLAGAFANGNLIWAQAFSDRNIWRYALAGQPIFGLGLAAGILAAELLHRRAARALGLTALVIWASNALSVGVIGFLVVVSGGF